MQAPPLKFLRISTAWSRRQWTSDATYKNAARTRMLNTDWFLSSQESIDWVATTEEPNVFLTSGNTTPKLHLPSSQLDLVF
jgi:hypothetical protein